MDPIFRKTYAVSRSHADRFGRLKPSALLSFAQETAEEHCAQLALGSEALALQNLFWAVVRHRVQLIRLPRIGETITIETWPMPTTRSAFPRATAAYDDQGNEVFRVISLWVLVDKTSRSMVLPEKSGIDLTGTLRGCELAAPASIVAKAMEKTVARRVGYTELDCNGHMNNARYMDWVDDLLPCAFHREHPAKEFTLCYHSEATEGQNICLDWRLDQDGCLLVNGHRETTNDHDGRLRVFSATVSF